MKKIGLALGSGGARGFCHIGVLQALEENHIPIDCIAGCSQGALVGGSYALGLSLSEMVEASHKLSQAALIDISISPKKFGLLKGQKAMNIIKKLIGERQFSDCKIPFTAVATDVVTAESVELSQGDINSAIRASFSLPVVFHAVEHEGRLLIDGGVKERIPIGAVKKMGADVVIAVDALGPVSQEFNPQQFTGLYSFINMITRAYLIIDWEGWKEKGKAADLTITPELGDKTLFMFSDNDSAIEQGRLATLAMMPQIRALIE